MNGSNATARINKTIAWGRLQLHALGRKISPLNMREEFRDPNRVSNMRVEIEDPSHRTHIIYDYSRQLVTGTTMSLLFKLAGAAGLKQKIDAMFNGVKINTTENRAVLHTALRQQTDDPIMVDGGDVIPGVKAVLSKVRQFTEEIHSGKRVGITGLPIKNIVAIAIGGSYLGPEFLAEACRAYAKAGMNLRFIANVDGTDFAQKTKDLNPAETMFIVISKTFTTAETMKNAKTAKEWMLKSFEDAKYESIFGHFFKKEELDSEIVKRHFIAVSTAEKLVKEFGIDTDNMFGFWDWVGGRYSATSAVGAVPLSLFLGFDKFQEILEGAYFMDQHFRNTPFEQNIPILGALLDIWNINFLGMKVRALLPYCQALLKLAPHVQQVEMESNGKSVDLQGVNIDYSTGEIVFGEPGTNGQHSFYQLIHQGMSVFCDFLGIVKPQYNVGVNSAKDVDHHAELLTNFFAQPDALAFGKTKEEAMAELLEQKKSREEADKLVNHKVFTGNRPTSSMLIDELNPFTVGVLLSWLEHRAAVKGFIWGINSFDQWGVELGKALGVRIRKIFLKANSDPEFTASEADELNPSTAYMVNRVIKNYLHKK